MVNEKSSAVGVNIQETVHFDIFANICTRLLTESHALKKIICAIS